MDRHEYVPLKRVCDNVFDCAFHEDEFDSVCSRFPFTRAIKWSSTLVLGLILLMVCVKTWKIFSHSIVCHSCMNQHRHLMSNVEWVKKHRLLTLLFENRCKEFVSISSFNTSTTSKELEEAYKDVHNDDFCSRNGMIDVYQYIA